jgi:hypothetical protein
MELTTIATLAHRSKPTKPHKKATTRHPFSLLRFPPAITTTYATMVTNSITTASDIRKPTDLHMEQKYLSVPWQSSYRGKSWHEECVDEQLRCKPIFLLKWPFLESTDHDIQVGMKFAVRVMAVPGSLLGLHIVLN